MTPGTWQSPGDGGAEHDPFWERSDTALHSDPAVHAQNTYAIAARTLAVFLRRWIMWAAVRLGALTNQAGREKWWTQAWRVALIAVVALPVITPAAVVIVISFLVFYLIEFLVWIPLTAGPWIQEKRNRTAKKVNRPTLRWKL